MAITKIHIVKKDDKELVYELTPSAKVAFESKHQIGWRKRILDEYRDSDLWWFAWFLQKAKGETTLDFGDEYVDQYRDVYISNDSKNGQTGAEKYGKSHLCRSLQE